MAVLQLRHRRREKEGTGSKVAYHKNDNGCPVSPHVGMVASLLVARMLVVVQVVT